MLPCRDPACFVVNRGSSVVRRAAIEHVASMEWSEASILRTRTSMSRTCTSTSQTKASAWRTCRERQRSCQCLRLKRYNANDNRVPISDYPFLKPQPIGTAVHRIVIPRFPQMFQGCKTRIGRIEILRVQVLAQPFRSNHNRHRSRKCFQTIEHLILQ